MKTLVEDGPRQALEKAELRAFERFQLDVRSSFVRLRDPALRVRVLEAGSGPPLLLLGGASASTWAPLMAEMRSARLIAVDRPGCGLSDPFDYGNVDLREHGVRFLSSLIEGLGLETPVFAGGSMGGLWGLWLALDRPEMVSGMVQLGCPALLFDTSPPLSTRIRSVRAVNMLAGARPELTLLDQVAGRGRGGTLPIEMRECLYRADVLWARGPTRLSLIERTMQLRGARREFRLEEAELARVKHPVLFFWGDRDEYGSPEAARLACACMSNAVLKLVPAGHLPWLDQPMACGEALREFMSNVAAGRAVRGGRSARPLPTHGTELHWLGQVLWGGSPGIQVRTDEAPVPGLRRVQTYTTFPSSSRPLLLTPVSPRGAAAASLLRYNALRPRGRRLARASAGIGLRLGVLQPLIRNRLAVWGDGSDPLLEHLRGVFHVPEVVVSIALGRPGPFRKPLLQAMTPAGRVLGYVKVGWNELTRSLVRNEAAALERRVATPLDLARVPRVIHSGAWQGLEICVTTPFPRDVRRYGGSALPSLPALAEVAGLNGIREAGLAESTYWARLGERIEASKSSAQTSERLSGFVDRLAKAYGTLPISFATWHGDWVPWNMGWADGRLFVWDWEHSAADVPFGFDLLHFQFQVEFISKRRSFEDAAILSRRRAVALLRGLGMAPTTGEIVFRLYLLEAFLRYFEPLVAGAGREPRFDPDSSVRLFGGAERAIGR